MEMISLKRFKGLKLPQFCIQTEVSHSSILLMLITGSLSCWISKYQFLKTLLNYFMRYGNMGCRVFKGGYKIGKIFALKPTYSKQIIEFWELVSKSAKIWILNSKIIRIFLNFCFHKECQFRSTFFVIDICC